MDKKVASELVKVARLLIADKVLDVASTDKWIEELKKGIHAPYLNIYASTLGGAENVSIMIGGSLDKKEDWANNILHNSRFFNVHLMSDGTLEMFSVGGRVKKMRKTSVTSADEAISKLNKWIDAVKDTWKAGW